MTREQKLALIVGFSLILFVGVLISDHLSSARKVKIGKVASESQSTPVTVAPMPPPGPAPESHAAAPGPPLRDPLDLIINAPVTVAPTTPPVAAATPSAEPAPANTAASTPIQTVASHNPSNTLVEEVRALGGDVINGSDGVPTIKLPPAMGIVNKPMTSPSPASQPRTIATPIGPIQPLKTHEVRAGDTLFQITQKYYGNGNLWRELAKFNNMDKAGTVRTGSRLKIPARDVLLGRSTPASNPDKGMNLLRPVEPKAPPKAAPPRDRAKPRIELASYTVRKGDTLGDISLKTLGTSKRWQEIADLNNLDDEDAISAGTVLRIPARRS